MADGFWKGRKVLITGHTGFKGAWLSLWLARLGANVVGYSLGPSTNPNLFDLLKIERMLVHCTGDVRDEKKLAEIFRRYKPEIVFHLAAQSLVRVSYREPRSTYETNVMGTVNILEAVRMVHGVRSVVNVTSDKCYENKELECGYRETDPMGGHDPYSSSKGCSELVTSAYLKSYFAPEGYGKTHTVALATARAGNVIGGGDWAADRIVPDCVRALLKNEDVTVRNPLSVRPWQHVLEPLSGYLLLARRLYEDGTRFSGAWNFGPDDYDAKPVKWLVERLCGKWGGRTWHSTGMDENMKQRMHEAHYLKLDCSKAKSELGWRPSWDLENAIDSIIEWVSAYSKGEDLMKVCLRQIEEYEAALSWT